MERKHLEKYRGQNYKCSICNYETTLKFQFKKHMTAHKSCNESHICKICKKQLMSRKTLAMHILTHSRIIRKHKCSLCFFTTTNKLLLNNHIKDHHTVKKIIPCKKCDKKFMSLRQLSVHKRSAHPQIKRNCTDCEFSCYSQGLMKKHANKHVIINYIQCEFCKKNIKDDAESLQKHSERHHCKLCDKVVSLDHKHRAKKECNICRKVVGHSHKTTW